MLSSPRRSVWVSSRSAGGQRLQPFDQQESGSPDHDMFVIARLDATPLLTAAGHKADSCSYSNSLLL